MIHSVAGKSISKVRFSKVIKWYRLFSYINWERHINWGSLELPSQMGTDLPKHLSTYSVLGGHEAGLVWGFPSASAQSGTEPSRPYLRAWPCCPWAVHSAQQELPGQTCLKSHCSFGKTARQSCKAPDFWDKVEVRTK